MELKSRKARFDEGLDILEQALTGQRFSYEGRHQTVLSGMVTPSVPPPVPPPVPSWLGAATPVARRRVAERGRNLLTSLLIDIKPTNWSRAWRAQVCPMPGRCRPFAASTRT